MGDCTGEDHGPTKAVFLNHAFNRWTGVAITYQDQPGSRMSFQDCGEAFQQQA
jgi:hypothetical protein